LSIDGDGDGDVRVDVRVDVCAIQQEGTMATSVSTIRGMNPDLAAKLKAEGVTNTDQLLQAAQQSGARRDLAKKLGMTPGELLELVNRADLARIKGIGDAYANLLEEAGVDSVKELAHRVPANLHERMAKLNEEKKLVPRVPTVEAITTWIDEAKQLGKSGAAVDE
jgi:predicted flap endonuclease-1-like 5' DNA nuclease